MSTDENHQWYTRPVLSVTDVEQSLNYYINMLGFTQAWSHEEAERTIVVQVNRGEGCDLILSEDSSRAGQARSFISLEPDELNTLLKDLEAKGVAIERSWWGYPIIVLKDPDGNEMIFPIEDET